MKNKILFTAIVLAILLGILIREDFFVQKKSSSEFRNLKLNGVVVNKIINKEKYEKTNTLIFRDNSMFIVPNMDLDNSIQIGDSIYKEIQDYKIIIYKKGNLNNKIVFALPCVE